MGFSCIGRRYDHLSGKGTLAKRLEMIPTFTSSRRWEGWARDSDGELQSRGCPFSGGAGTGFVRGEVLLGQLAGVRGKWVVWGQRTLASPRLISFVISFSLSIHIKYYDFDTTDECVECLNKNFV
jgi:hypothetical protein